mgnify:CR=1 FL=1
MNTREFLDVIYRNVEDGYICIPYIENGNVITKWFHSSEIDSIATYIIEEGVKHNTYYCINPRKKRLSTYIRGSDKDVKCVVALYQDYDIKGCAHKQKALTESKEKLLEFLEKECPIKPSFLIWSGNGIHAIWLLETPYEIEDDSSYISSVLKGWEAYLKAKAIELYGWKFDSVADTARMLRVLGTVNFKTDARPICEIIQYDDIRYFIEDFESYIVAQTKCNSPAKSTSEEFDDFDCMGTGDSEKLIGLCEFLQYCRDNAVNLPEPLWQVMISNIALTADGHDRVHELSSPYPNYTYEETEKKYRLAVKNDMPITCAVIHEIGYECKNCHCGVKAPISLIREGTSKPVEWEQPISFDDFVFPEFLTGALPEPIRDYVVALAESTQTPVDMAAASSLAFLSVCLQGKFRVKAKDDWSEPLNTFVLNIMEPSERKSAVENAMIRPINIFEAEQNSAKAVDISDWAGKLVGNVLRIAGLLCRASVYRCHDFLADVDELIVSKETMESAIAIGRYFIEHARAAFSLMRADETIKQSRYVLSEIKNVGLAEVT